MIKEIIEKKAIEVNFQALVSVRTKRVYGFEALCRCNYEGMTIAPNKLFYLAKKEGLLLELDRLARLEAVKKFHSYYQKNPDLILFINFESNLINDGVYSDGIQPFVDLIRELEMPFSNFLIEIKEDEIPNNDALESFCRKYQNLGFLVALDDFGIGSSNFERINLVRPDIIKIDKALFKDISTNHISQEIVKAITSMSNNIGTRVLAEGVEDLDAVIISMNMGINIFQGFFFHRPESTFLNKQKKEVLGKLETVGDIFKTQTLNTLNEKKETIKVYNKMIKKIISGLNSIYNADLILNKKLENYENIEALYLIDLKNSKQIGNTMISQKVNNRFRPTKDGDEHYLKEYYFITKESKDGTFLSEKYISYATGNICKTFARTFNINNDEYIICMDIIVKE